MSDTFSPTFVNTAGSPTLPNERKEKNASFLFIRDFNGHLPYPFQNPISNFYLSLEAGKSSIDSVILRKLTNVEIIFRAWTKSLKRTKLYFDD